MRDDHHELPTPRSRLRTGYVRVVLTCWSCRHQRDADLAGLIDAGRGDVPLTELRWRCSRCRSARIDMICTSHARVQAVAAVCAGSAADHHLIGRQVVWGSPRRHYEASGGNDQPGRTKRARNAFTLVGVSAPSSTVWERLVLDRLGVPHRAYASPGDLLPSSCRKLRRRGS